LRAFNRPQNTVLFRFFTGTRWPLSVMRVVSICAVRELHCVNVDLVITQSRPYRKNQSISLHAMVFFIR